MSKQRVLDIIAVVLNWAVLGFCVGILTAAVMIVGGIVKWGLD